MSVLQKFFPQEGAQEVETAVGKLEPGLDTVVDRLYWQHMPGIVVITEPRVGHRDYTGCFRKLIRVVVQRYNPVESRLKRCSPDYYTLGHCSFAACTQRFGNQQNFVL